MIRAKTGNLTCGLRYSVNSSIFLDKYHVSDFTIPDEEWFTTSNYSIKQYRYEYPIVNLVNYKRNLTYTYNATLITKSIPPYSRAF